MTTNKDYDFYVKAAAITLGIHPELVTQEQRDDAKRKWFCLTYIRTLDGGMTEEYKRFNRPWPKNQGIW